MITRYDVISSSFKSFLSENAGFLNFFNNKSKTRG